MSVDEFETGLMVHISLSGTEGAVDVYYLKFLNCLLLLRIMKYLLLLTDGSKHFS